MRSTNRPPTTPVPTLREASSYFARLVVLIRPYWGQMTRGFVLSIVIGGVGLVTPYVSKLYFDNVYPARDFSLLHALVIAVAVITVASTFMGAVRGYYAQVVGAKLGNAVGLMYFNRVQHLPIRFFEEHRVGEIMSRLGDMRGALGTVSRIFQTVLVSGVYLLIVPPILIALNWRLALLSLVATPITSCISAASGRITRRFMKRTAESNAELGALQVESLSQMRTLKAMAVEHRVFRDAVEQTEESIGMQLKGSGVGAIVGIVNAIIRGASTAVFTWYAWTLILRGELTLGTFIAFSAYLGYLIGPVNQFAGLFTDFQQAAVTLGRAFEYLDLATEQDPEQAFKPPAAILHRIRGDIELDHLTFGYVAGKPVLQDLSMRLAPGSVTAIVGPSGAGKSTVLRLLCRIDEPTGGSIRMDGTPLDRIPLSELRRQVAVVWQDPSLLRGTIRENLTFGLESVPSERVMEAVRICSLDEVIGDLPEGLDTVVAEWGATMSGGQRQRFAIARALIREAPVLLLDEVTSQLDVRTEETILRELIPRLRDRTVLLVTHRLSTASLADRIAMLDRGRLVAYGTHDELVAQNGVYCQMLRTDGGEETRRLRRLEVR